MAFALALSACNPAEPVTSIDNTTFAAGLGVDLAASTKTASGLYYRDITVGGGATAIAGHTIAVHYTGALANGTIFDANGTNATPFSFVLGQGKVIAGWDEGVAGMKVGGSRQLIIPPALGYGAGGQGPIPGNAILVFTVIMVSTS
jgi:FKBP-type peptidyl-prolyl cis-trans isomerase